MEERQELVELKIQLPVGALEGFSRLAEQLRRLTEALGGGGQAPASPGMETVERGENPNFDFGQFRQMGRGPEEPEGVRAGEKDIPGAEAVEAMVRRVVEAPAGAWSQEEESAADDPRAVLAEQPVQDLPQPEETQPAPSPQPEESEERSPQAEEETEGPEVSALRVEVEDRALEAAPVQMEPESPVPDAPAVRMEPDSQIPAAEEAWTEPVEPAAEAAAVREEVLRTLETPPGAGVELSAAPETLKSRWTDVTEELVSAGPAPLTAESVSLAFRRDGRRYDSGFPLY